MFSAEDGLTVDQVPGLGKRTISQELKLDNAFLCSKAWVIGLAQRVVLSVWGDLGFHYRDNISRWESEIPRMPLEDERTIKINDKGPAAERTRNPARH